MEKLVYKLRIKKDLKIDREMKGASGIVHIKKQGYQFVPQQIQISDTPFQEQLIRQRLPTKPPAPPVSGVD